MIFERKTSEKEVRLARLKSSRGTKKSLGNNFISAKFKIIIAGFYLIISIL